MRRTRQRSKRRQDFFFGLVVTFFATLLLAMCFFPIYTMLELAVKPGYERIYNFWGWPKHPSWGSYQWAWRQLAPSLFNTMALVMIACVGTLLFSLAGGYAFARLKFPGKELLYLLVLALMMVPSVLTLTPTYTMVKSYGLYDTWWAVLLPWVAAGQIWGVPLVRNYLEGIPGDLFEAARIDGASELACMWHVCLPLAKPILATVAVIKMVDFYNDFIWPLLVIESSSRQVVTVMIRMHGNNVASYVIACLPLLVLFLCTSRLYMEGLVSGAVKS